MKRLLVFVSLTVAGVLGLAACAGDGNSNTANANRSSNTNSVMNHSMNHSMNNSMNMNSSSGNANSNSVASVQDNFWSEAAQGGMAEVELAKLALTKAQNAEVKKFAQMMITDHTKANTELKTLAAKKNVTLPTDIGSHKSTMDDLTKLSGAEFDKAYVEAMVDDHEEDVELFEDAADNSDADIKAFAAKTLPTLKSHLEMIKGIQSKMK